MKRQLNYEIKFSFEVRDIPQEYLDLFIREAIDNVNSTLSEYSNVKILDIQHLSD